MDCMQYKEEFYECIPVDAYIHTIFNESYQSYLNLEEPIKPMEMCVPHIKVSTKILGAKVIQNHKSHMPLQVFYIIYILHLSSHLFTCR